MPVPIVERTGVDDAHVGAASVPRLPQRPAPAAETAAVRDVGATHSVHRAKALHNVAAALVDPLHHKHGIRKAYARCMWRVPYFTLIAVTLGVVCSAISFSAIRKIADHIALLGMDVGWAQMMARWGLAFVLMIQIVMLIAGFLTTGNMRWKHCTPHKNESRMTHWCKEWGMAMSCILILMCLFKGATGYMSVVCREPLEVKEGFAEIMNAVQIPYVRPYEGKASNNSGFAGAPPDWSEGPKRTFRVPKLYLANVLDYCNCPANATTCVGDYMLGAVTLDGGRSADPKETDDDAKRMFVTGVVVLIMQMHLFMLTGTNVASLHLTVQGHYHRPGALKKSRHGVEPP
jgi:hypothetical protein